MRACPPVINHLLADRTWLISPPAGSCKLCICERSPQICQLRHLQACHPQHSIKNVYISLSLQRGCCSVMPKPVTA